MTLTIIKWLSPRLIALIILISPLPLLYSALVVCDWLDPPQYAHEACVETSRGSTVCGDLVRY
jgi:hypothetical protein